MISVEIDYQQRATDAVRAAIQEARAHAMYEIRENIQAMLDRQVPQTHIIIRTSATVKRLIQPYITGSRYLTYKGDLYKIEVEQEEVAA